MALGNEPENSLQPQIENRLREKRHALGLSQKQLADRAGITRQAVSAVEANQYSPATSVALQLARALQCRVEDLFSIRSRDDVVEAEWLGPPPKSAKVRAQIVQVGSRLLARPLDGAGGLTSLTACADGLIVAHDSRRSRATLKLLKNRAAVRSQVVIGGCDPAIFLAAQHVGRYSNGMLAPWLMGSSTALAALRRGNVHVAGVHFVENRSGAWNPKGDLGSLECSVITFAHWEEGIIAPRGNPQKIRAVQDLARPTVKIVNREKGSGARRLLDRELAAAGIPAARVKGYGDEVSSHLEVAAKVHAGAVDAGVGVRAAATICGLDFILLQRERYDLIFPKAHYENLPGLRIFLDVMVTRTFRDELEALGGYDTRETGNVVEIA